MNIMTEKFDLKAQAPVMACSEKIAPKTPIVLATIKKQTGCISEQSILQGSTLPSISHYKGCFESQDQEYSSTHTTISTEKLLLILQATKGYQPSQECIENLQVGQFDDEELLSFNAAL